MEIDKEFIESIDATIESACGDIEVAFFLALDNDDAVGLERDVRAGIAEILEALEKCKARMEG